MRIFRDQYQLKKEKTNLWRESNRKMEALSLIQVQIQEAKVPKELPVNLTTTDSISISIQLLSPDKIKPEEYHQRE